MELGIRYRGRVATSEDVALIERVIRETPGLTRSGLSRRLCELWNWRQPNGVLRDMVCRGLLLALERAGQIRLPVARRVLGGWNRCVPRKEVEEDETPIVSSLAQLQPLDILQVRRSAQEQRHDSLLQQYHYLGYTRPVGEHLKFLIYAKGRIVSCICFSSAPRHLGARDRFLGWQPEIRRRNLHLLAYNPRFLILPWVRVPHLASHILGLMVRRISKEWEAIYSHPLYFLETFVDVEKYPGTCYRAANWIYLGQTTGRGKDDLTHRPNRSIKAVWGYPLHRDFRRLLQHG